jgi:Subtilase family
MRIVWLLLAVLFTTIVTDVSGNVINPRLLPVLHRADQADLIPVVVLLHPRHQVSDFATLIAGMSRDDRQAVLWAEISERSQKAQTEILEILRTKEARGHASRITPLMIANGIGVHATQSVLRELSTHPQVRHIFHTPEEMLLPDLDQFDSSPPGELDEIAWSVAQVEAPAVWDEGYTGEGVLVAVLDTGVRYTHLDLEDHLWDGGLDYPNHGWDFYNDDNDPYDSNGVHGTHTSGSICGDGTAGFNTGVAPDATLMCLQVLNSEGNGSQPDVYAALDFCLEQGVDVTSISLGWIVQDDITRATFRNHFDLLNLAGTISAACAGNENGGFNIPPDNIRTPADCPPPFIHPDQTGDGEVSGMLAVGATDSDDWIASFSSFGPSHWGSVDPYNDWPYGGGDPGCIKPELCAPGVQVLSLGTGSDSDYINGDGTSMATPHVAGAACLLLGADPYISNSELAEALLMSALPLGPPGMDNAFGTGRLDCFAAFEYIDGGEIVFVELMPLQDPYMIPPAGRMMHFNAVISNRLTSPAQGDAWAEIRLHNGAFLLDSYRINFQPGVDIVVNNVTQNVPAGVPSGTYQFVVTLGNFPNTVAAQDSFTFIKSGQAGSTISKFPPSVLVGTKGIIGTIVRSDK